MHGSQRIEAFDVIRGFSLVSMIAFHASYDLVSLYGVSLTWFVFPYIDHGVTVSHGCLFFLQV